MVQFGAYPVSAACFRSCLAFGLAFSLTAVGCSDSAKQGDKQIASPPAAPAAGVAAKDAKAAADDELRQRLDDAIAGARSRQMDPKVNNAWQIVHGLLCFGPDLKITVDGEPTPALSWLFSGGQLKGWVLVPGEKGLKDVEEPGSKSGEGHDDQWLGYLSQSGIGADDKIQVKDETFKVSDLVTQAQWDVHEGMEGTWTLMAFSKYVPLDARWTARDGTEWSIERLVGMEAAQDLNASACGGSHRLFGITCALNSYIQDGGKAVKQQLDDGKGPEAWQAGYDKVLDAMKKAHDYQQADGGFSTNFFSRPGNSPDIALRINSTGHTFEFLAMALPQDELKKPWMTKAALFLCDMLDATIDQDLECGGLYHAVHGLILYRDRLYGPEKPATAAKPAASQTADKQ
jgi:hypothetical protein